jgi:tetratricopeptide (TPR) repeat protein
LISELVNLHNFDALHLLGVSALDCGRLDLAEQALTQASLPLGQNAEANQSFDRALSLDPRHMEAMFGKGLASINLRHFDEALAAFDTALAIKPGAALVRAQRGRLHQQVGQFDQAKTDYDAALARDPMLDMALLGAAQINVIRDNIAPAMDACRKVLEQNPSSDVAWTWLGACFGRQGELATALQHFDRALELKPDYGDAITAKIFTLDFMPEADFARHQAARREWWQRIGAGISQATLPPRDLDRSGASPSAMFPPTSEATPPHSPSFPS